MSIENKTNEVSYVDLKWLNKHILPADISVQKRLDFANINYQILRNYNNKLKRKEIPQNNGEIDNTIAYAVLGLFRVMESDELRVKLSRKRLHSITRLLNVYSGSANDYFLDKFRHNQNE